MFSDIEQLRRRRPISYDQVVDKVKRYSQDNLVTNPNRHDEVLRDLAVLLHLNNLDCNNLESSIDAGLTPLITSLIGTYNPSSFDEIIDSNFNRGYQYVSTIGGETQSDQEILAAYVTSIDATKLCDLYFDEYRALRPQDYQIIYYPVPRFCGFYANVPKYTGQLTFWGRDESAYPRPKEMTLTEYVESRIKSESPLSILDVGVGDGFFMKTLKRAYGSNILVTGIGLENETIPEIDEHIVGPIELADLPHDSFDLIVSNFALGYVLWPDIAYEKLLLALKPSGLAVLEIPLQPYRTGTLRNYQIRDQMLRNYNLNIGRFWDYESAQQIWGDRFEKIDTDDMVNIREQALSLFSEYVTNIGTFLSYNTYTVSEAMGGSSAIKVAVTISKD